MWFYILIFYILLLIWENILILKKWSFIPNPNLNSKFQPISWRIIHFRSNIVFVICLCKSYWLLRIEPNNYIANSPRLIPRYAKSTRRRTVPQITKGRPRVAWLLLYVSKRITNTWILKYLIYYFHVHMESL